MNDDPWIVVSYLTENGISAYVWGSSVYARVEIKSQYYNVNIEVWPARSAIISSILRDYRVQLPHIESPTYIEELKDILAEIKEFLWGIINEYHDKVMRRCRHGGFKISEV